MACRFNPNLKFRYIYKTTNLINGKIYVGSHCSDISPDRDPYLGSGFAFNKAILKYGKENFKREILEFYEGTDYLEFNNLESLWIRKLDSIRLGYNLTENSGGGYINKETYQKLSDQWSGVKKNPESIKKSVETKRKNGTNFHSEEVKGRIRESVHKTYENIDVRMKCSLPGDKNGFYHKNHSQDTKNILRNIALNRPKETCHHCGRIMAVNQIKGYHGDKCKLKI